MDVNWRNCAYDCTVSYLMLQEQNNTATLFMQYFYEGKEIFIYFFLLEKNEAIKASST